MVYKVSKGGVRSGNTLRGLRTLESRRYSRQACIVGRSSLPANDVSCLLESNTDNGLVSSTLQSTDVILSLNKKRRWNIPAIVSHMIKDGNFKENKVMVSLLERHKLKRRANCVSLVCNKGRFGHVVPKQKRYFSFNLENIDEEDSNRKKRRQIAEQKKKVMALTGGERKNKNTDMQTSTVFTVSGSNANNRSSEIMQSSKPEYRLEVFYPCPRSCSLAFNPKYTDVALEMNEDGTLEMRSNKKSKKSQRKHRKRFSKKDLDYFNTERIENETEEAWSGVDASEDILEPQFVVGNEKLNMSIQDGDLDCSGEYRNNPSQFSENILQSLIAHAEKARSLSVQRPQDHRRNTSGKKSDSAKIGKDDKSHIVYVESTKSVTQRVNASLSSTPAPLATIDFARVILSATEASMFELREKFGSLYAEAESEPRRFVINITDNVQNILSPSYTAEQNLKYLSYLVFIHDGCYDEGYSTFKVCFNSNVCTKGDAICKTIPFEQTSIDNIMNRIICTLLDMKQNNMLNINGTLQYSHSRPSRFDLINSHLKVTVESFHTTDEFLFTQTRGMQERSEFSAPLDVYIEHLDMDMFCGICYENVNPTQFDAAPGTQLTKCGHLFCDECWKSHFHTKSSDGAVEMLCPSYQCDITVGPVTLLSLLHVSEVSQLWQRRQEMEIDTSQNSRWCPNPECGRVIRLKSTKLTPEDTLDVMCACGTEVCFSCLAPAHWPAKCHQAEKYVERLSTLKLPKEFTDEPVSTVVQTPIYKKNIPVLEVEGRICPRCLRFIEKNQGCSYMVCRCGYAFCWECMKTINSHTNNVCKPDPSFLYKYIRRVKVRHIQIPQIHSFDTPPQPEPEVKKPTTLRNKVTMYQRALQQRLEARDKKCSTQIRNLARKIASVAQKDPGAKTEFLLLFGVETKGMDEGSLMRYPLVALAVKYLKLYEELKCTLHHVTEFTFVLLQDASDSLSKRKALRLANDLSGYCSFIKSILELGSNQDVWTAVKRLTDIQIWANRGISALLSVVHDKSGLGSATRFY